MFKDFQYFDFSPFPIWLHKLRWGNGGGVCLRGWHFPHHWYDCQDGLVWSRGHIYVNWERHVGFRLVWKVLKESCQLLGLEGSIPCGEPAATENRNACSSSLRIRARSCTFYIYIDTHTHTHTHTHTYTAVLGAIVSFRHSFHWSTVRVWNTNTRLSLFVWETLTHIQGNAIVRDLRLSLWFCWIFRSSETLFRADW